MSAAKRKRAEWVEIGRTPRGLYFSLEQGPGLYPYVVQVLEVTEEREGETLTRMEDGPPLYLKDMGPEGKLAFRVASTVIPLIEGLLRTRARAEEP